MIVMSPPRRHLPRVDWLEPLKPYRSQDRHSARKLSSRLRRALDDMARCAQIITAIEADIDITRGLPRLKLIHLKAKAREQYEEAHKVANEEKAKDPLYYRAESSRPHSYIAHN